MPSLELLVSPPGTGKTIRCIELFKASLLKSKAGIHSRSFFVLPSREHADRIQSLIVRKDVQGLFNAHILTIQDLADRVLERGKGRPTESVRRAAVADALDPADGTEYGYFRESLDLAGFRELALESLLEFKSSLLSVAEFEKRAQSLLKDPVFRSKFRDFSILAKRYDARLESLSLAEPEDELARTDALEGEGPDLVIFDGFYHFSRAQKKLLALVSKWASRTVVTLTLDPKHPGADAIFDYPARTRKFLAGIGFKEVSPGSKNHRTADPALRHLAAHLFSPKPAVFKEAAPLAVFSAPSRRVEYEMIAREIRRLYRAGGHHFSDVCVILRAVSGRKALIESVFSEYGVPVAIHERARLLESGLASALWRFLRLPVEGWRREDVVFLAKSSYFRERLPIREALEIERGALREGLAEGRAAWAALAAGDALPPSAKAFLAALLGEEERLASAPGAHAFGARIDAFVSALPAESELDQAAKKSLASILAAGRRRYGSGKEAFVMERHLKDVLAALEGGLLSLKPAGRNRVQVYDAVMALPKEYKTVFVADLLEKVFPQAVTEDPLFKDEERRAMNGKGEPVLEERRWRHAGERYFFYMALSRARERVYLTHSTHDADGKPLLRSFFVDEALAAFAPGAVRREDAGLADFLPPPGEWESEADVLRGVASYLSAASAPGFIAGLSARFGGHPALARAASWAASAGPARLRDPKTLEALKKLAGPFSATSLEAFARCPYRHFAETLLRLERPPEGYEDAEMGNVLHKTLYLYFSGLSEAERKSGAYWKEPGEMERKLEALLDETLEEKFRDQPLYRRAMFRDALAAMLRRTAALERRLARERGLVPALFEYDFGKEGARPLRIPSPGGEILLRGSIDRIDTDASGKKALLIDYKKSSRGLRKKIDKGEEIQLPLYFLAARQLLGLEPLGVEHRVMRSGEVENPELTPQEIDALLEETEARIRETVGRIRSADISVAPAKADSCKFCPNDPLCRIEDKKDGHD